VDGFVVRRQILDQRVYRLVIAVGVGLGDIGAGVTAGGVGWLVVIVMFFHFVSSKC